MSLYTFSARPFESDSDNDNHDKSDNDDIDLFSKTKRRKKINEKIGARHFFGASVRLGGFGITSSWSPPFLLVQLVELVLDLEQSSLDELYAKPRPKDSPTGKANGLGPPKRPGRGPNKDGPPSKGAGMNGEIGNGW